MFDLKQWAAEHKMTQKQIAQMSGTSTQPISALMNDGHCLEETIIKVCSGIGRPYRREEWKEHILKNEAPNRPRKRKIKLEYDQDDDYSPFPYFHVDNEVLAWRELPEPWEGANNE